MKSVLLTRAVFWMSFGLIPLALWIFWRGHQNPGGGFVGGLVVVVFVAMLRLGDYLSSAGTIKMRVWAERLVVIGLTVALFSAAISPIFFGTEFMKGLWIELPWIGSVGTPVMFDFGVFLLVAGVGSGLMMVEFSE